MVQLQDDKDRFAAHNATVLAVFREEENGLQGLQRVRDKLEADFLLALDDNAAQTEAYGVGPPVFETFLIDPKGIIRAILSGETYDRPSSEDVAGRLEQLRNGRGR